MLTERRVEFQLTLDCRVRSLGLEEEILLDLNASAISLLFIADKFVTFLETEPVIPESIAHVHFDTASGAAFSSKPVLVAKLMLVLESRNQKLSSTNAQLLYMFKTVLIREEAADDISVEIVYQH